MPNPTSSGSAYRLALPAWAGAGLAVSTLMVMSPVAQAETLTAWQFDPASQQLTLTLPAGVTPTYRVEANPARIVLTLPETQVGSGAAQHLYSGAVRQVSLSQVDRDMVMVLDLAPGAVLAENGVSLVALNTEAPSSAGQVRWVLTAQATVPVSPLAAAPPTGSGMVVELPIIPSNDPRLGFPAAGTGRLSTSAANLMLPSDVDSLTNLPETLPVDPFNLGASGQQVSVPSLAELDAVAGPVAAVPQGAAAPDSAPTVDLLPPVAPPPGSGSVLALEPPPLGTASTPAIAPNPAPAITAAPEVAVTPPDVNPAVAPIDGETSGLPITVVPPEGAALEPAAPAVAAPTIPAVEPAAIAPDSDVPAEPSPAVPAVPEPALPTVNPAAIASEPPVAPAGESSVPEVATAPLPTLETPPAPSAAPANAIAQEPPAIATLPVAVEGNDPNLLAVPTAPNTRTQGAVVPPAEPVVLAAAGGQPIFFGSPLPSRDLQATSSGAVSPAPAERPLSPDTLIAAGTILELRYVGDEPLDLNTSSTQNQVLLLAHDIRDPITNGIVAPAGSQLIGQFEPSPNGQRWVSKQLISPDGDQVAFATTTDYLVGTPEISTPRLAAGVGLGALALMVVTSFSGIGLLGGALIGATTAVGTSPQHIVVEPNQIIQVQVMQDVPRAIPIASVPEYSREWGMGGW